MMNIIENATLMLYIISAVFNISVGIKYIKSINESQKFIEEYQKSFEECRIRNLELEKKKKEFKEEQKNMQERYKRLTKEVDDNVSS